MTLYILVASHCDRSVTVTCPPLFTVFFGLKVPIRSGPNISELPDMVIFEDSTFIRGSLLSVNGSIYVKLNPTADFPFTSLLCERFVYRRSALNSGENRLSPVDAESLYSMTDLKTP